MAWKANDEVTCALSSMAAQDWTSKPDSTLHVPGTKRKRPALQNCTCYTAQAAMSKGHALLFAKSAVGTNVESEF